MIDPQAKLIVTGYVVLRRTECPLAKQGKSREAPAKCDAALNYAPNWKQLKEAREVLAKQKS
jgi:hypothetical protein